MIEILTSTGVFLDLDPDTEFELTIENPILSDDRMPAPWSTDISFAPTAKNKRVFGWLDALLLEPTVREIGATIVAHGIHLLSGTLVYDGISDGKVKYTFTALDYSSEWSEKLYQLPFLGDKNYGIEYMQQVVAGSVDGVKAPVVVNRALVADASTTYESDGATITDTFNLNRKYRNASDMTEPSYGFIPAVTVSKILTQAFGNKVSADNNLKSLFGALVVFGSMWNKFLPMTKSGTYSLNVFDAFPDMSLSDFLEELCKMTCSAIYNYRGRLYIIGFEYIVSDADIIVWDDKVSDSFEVSGADKSGYSLSFKDSASGSSVSETVKYTQDDLSKVGEDTYGIYEYRAVKHTHSGDIYSVKWDTTRGTKEWLIDRLGGTEAYEREGDDMYDVSVDLIPAVCAPIKFYLGLSDYRKGMAPIIEIPGIGDARPTDVYIALFGYGQATDNGYVMTMDSDTFGKGYGDDINLGYSLKPEWLFEHYHKSYADWLAKDRSTVTVDVNLSIYELAALKIWSKVSIYGRIYIISQISIRMTAKIGSMLTVSCELISF